MHGFSAYRAAGQHKRAVYGSDPPRCLPAYDGAAGNFAASCRPRGVFVLTESLHLWVPAGVAANRTPAGSEAVPGPPVSHPAARWNLWRLSACEPTGGYPGTLESAADSRLRLKLQVFLLDDVTGSGEHRWVGGAKPHAAERLWRPPSRLIRLLFVDLSIVCFGSDFYEG